MKAARAVLMAGVCGLSAGCGPVAVRARSRSPVAIAQATHEYPSARARAAQSAAGFRTPVEAVRAFATAYINWSSQTVVLDMRALAEVSIGQARATVQLAAAQTAGDYELHRAGISNSGQVEAVAPLGENAGRYVVVTRELTAATATNAYQGLQPTWHVTIATVAQIEPGIWVLSGWQPES